MLIKPQVIKAEDTSVEEVVETQIQEKEVIVENTQETTESDEQPVEETPEQTEVAVTEQPEQNTSVTAKRESGVKAFISEQAEIGYEGLEVGAFSFDGVKLSEGQFLVGSEEHELGTSFEFVTMSTRNRYVVRQGEFNDAETFYSYCPNGSTLTDGSSAEEKLAEWRGDGYGVEGAPLDIRKYLEVMAELVVEDEEYNGAIVNLSIPPSSLQRFGGVSMIAKARYKATLGEVVIKAIVGAKVGEGQKAFRPWNFKISRKLA